MEDAKNAKQVFDRILSGLASLDGAVLAESDAKIRLGVDERQAAIMAAADVCEKKSEINESLIALLQANNVEPQEVLREVVKRKIGRALGLE
jgi:hypothetical protein